MHTLHVGPLMFLSCALGLATTSWLSDAMAVNKYALSYTALTSMDKSYLVLMSLKVGQYGGTS